MKNGDSGHHGPRPEPYIHANQYRQYRGGMSNSFSRYLGVIVGVIAFISVFLGIGTLATSSWVLHRALQQQKNPTLATATDLLHQVNTFFGGTTGLYDLDVIFRIFISVSATTLAASFVQFIMSFWLMLATVKGGRNMAKIWVGVQVGTMVAIGGGFLCIITNDLEINPPTLIFLIVSGTNFFLMIVFCLIVFIYSYSNEDTAV